MQVDSIRKPTALQITLKAFKTDPFRTGMDVNMGQVQEELSPLVAILTYMLEGGARLRTFFHYDNGRSLTRIKVAGRDKSSPHKSRD